METLADLPDLVHEPDGSQVPRVEYLSFLRVLGRFFHKKQGKAAYKYHWLAPHDWGGLASDDKDWATIRSADRKIYNNCCDPTFNDTGVDKTSALAITWSMLMVQLDWKTLPQCAEHFGDLLR